MSESPPATMRPLYKAGITFFILGVALTKKHPIMDVTIEAAPKRRGYIIPLAPLLVIIRPPRTMVAIKVTA